MTSRLSVLHILFNNVYSEHNTWKWLWWEPLTNLHGIGNDKTGTLIIMATNICSLKWRALVCVWEELTGVYDPNASIRLWVTSGGSVIFILKIDHAGIIFFVKVNWCVVRTAHHSSISLKQYSVLFHQFSETVSANVEYISWDISGYHTNPIPWINCFINSWV